MFHNHEKYSSARNCFYLFSREIILIESTIIVPFCSLGGKDLHRMLSCLFHATIIDHQQFWLVAKKILLMFDLSSLAFSFVFIAGFVMKFCL